MSDVEYLEVADYVIIASEILDASEKDVLRVLKLAAVSSAMGAPVSDYFGVGAFP